MSVSFHAAPPLVMVIPKQISGSPSLGVHHHRIYILHFRHVASWRVHGWPFLGQRVSAAHLSVLSDTASSMGSFGEAVSSVNTVRPLPHIYYSDSARSPSSPLLQRREDVVTGRNATRYPLCEHVVTQITCDLID